MWISDKWKIQIATYTGKVVLEIERYQYVELSAEYVQTRRGDRFSEIKILRK